MNNDDLIKLYQKSLTDHGAGPKAVQWADAETQAARFAVLSEISDQIESVLDVGCGLADFCYYLRSRGSNARYLGVDIVPEFVELATNSLAEDPIASVELLSPDDPLPEGHDYAVLSGVFNNKRNDNWGFMTDTLSRMWKVAKCGIAFNAMTSHVDYFDDDLWYVDPMRVFEFCKNELGGHPVLRHDYALREGGFPFEFAIYVYKQPRSV